MSVKLSNRDLAKLVKKAEAQGWTVRLRSNNHLVWKNPEGRSYFSASTPSDRRAVLNITQGLRAFGLDKERVL